MVIIFNILTYITYIVIWTIILLHEFIDPWQAPQRGRGPLRLRLPGGAPSDETRGAEPGAAAGGPRASPPGRLRSAGKCWENVGKYRENMGKCGNLLILSVLFSEHISEYMEIWWNIEGHICNIDGTFMEKSWNIIQTYDDKWGIYHWFYWIR